MSYTLDKSHWHEAMDRTHVIAQMFSDFVEEHPVIQQDKDLKVDAELILEAMEQLYQRIGRKEPKGTKTPNE